MSEVANRAPLATTLDGWALTPVEVPPLKGFDGPVAAYRLDVSAG
jgi:hypothetical protein